MKQVYVCVCFFSIAALMNFNTNLVALNKTNLLSYSSGHQKSRVELTGQKSKYQEGCIPFGGSRVESLFCLFFAHSFASDLILSSSKQHGTNTSETVISPVLSASLLLPLIRTLWLGPSR